MTEGALLNQLAAAVFDRLVREWAIQVAVFLLAATGSDFLAGEGAEEAGFRMGARGTSQHQGYCESHHEAHI